MTMGALRVLLSVTLAAGAVPVNASEDWMNEDDLRHAFAGKTIQGQYATGKSFTESYKADGAISYEERDVAYRGHWSLQAGTFCTIYDTDPAGGCYQVRKVGDNCYEFYFVARTEQEAAEEGPGAPSWTARAAVSDRDPTCSDKPSV